MAWDSQYYFDALSGVYYFDDYRNVYFHDGTLIHDGSDAPDWDDLLTPHFYLDDIAYWFDDQGLLFQGTDGIPYRADVWQDEQQWDQPDQSQTSSFTSDATIDATYTPTVKRKLMEDEPVHAYAYHCGPQMSGFL
ncbi:hypothetical protein B0J17DRAFT_706561 [Rhizoctonia solani]|nr:hypothetical protein B0J17DRAFT_706561 [Rhizoctonia solani]